MKLDYQTLGRAFRKLDTGADPAETVERLYIIADLMEATDKAIEAAWRGLDARSEACVEEILGDYDFLMRGKALRAMADAWQDGIDNAQEDAA